MARTRSMDGWRRAARVAAWNALLLVAGLALFAGGFETWLRLTQPFEETTMVWKSYPRVGSQIERNSEVRFTNGLDFWTVTRINSLGFPDREPIDPGRAAESCHVAVIGDSMVEALQVSIDEKLHVRLEDIAAETMPDLDVTASAWGLMGTGQIAQTAYYDEFARRMSPKLVVLVFVPNDFIDNVPLLNALRTGYDPDHLPQPSAERSEDGSMTLRPADGESFLHKLPRPPLPHPAEEDATFRLESMIDARTAARSEYDRWIALATHRAAILAERPRYAPILAEGRLPYDAWQLFGEASDRLREYALAYTSFGLDRFKERADRDGAHLVILAIQQMQERANDSPFYVLRALAEERGIPVIDQYDYALRQGLESGDLRWRHDGHWNALGHRMAAEALAEWLAGNRRVCDARDGSSP